jgi:hypothetical protein
MIECSICNKEVEGVHEFDKKACVGCGNEYFDSVKPDLTRWMEGLTVSEKSDIIRSLVKDHYEKEREYKKHEQEALASCCASYEELRMFKLAS